MHNRLLFSCKGKGNHEFCRVMDGTGKHMKIPEALKVKHSMSCDLLWFLRCVCLTWNVCRDLEMSNRPWGWEKRHPGRWGCWDMCDNVRQWREYWGQQECEVTGHTAFVGSWQLLMLSPSPPTHLKCFYLHALIRQWQFSVWHFTHVCNTVWSYSCLSPWLITIVFPISRTIFHTIFFLLWFN